MKALKNLVTAFVLVTVFSVTAAAQTFSGTAAANAEVVTAMSVTGTAMDYGNIYESTTYTITADSSAAAKFAVTGATTSASVNVDIDFPTVLGGPGTDMSTGSYEAIVNLSSDDNSSGTAALASAVSNNVNDDITTSGSSFWVYAGMAVTSNASQTAGSYTGTITLTLAYN